MLTPIDHLQQLLKLAQHLVLSVVPIPSGQLDMGALALLWCVGCFFLVPKEAVHVAREAVLQTAEVVLAIT